MTGGDRSRRSSEQIRAPGSRLAGYISATGSAGTIAAGDFLRTKHPARQGGRHRGAAVPDALPVRLRRAPHRGHRRQARAVGPQRAQHRHGRRDRRRAGACSSLRLFNEDAGQRATSQKQGVKTDVARAAAAGWASPASATSSPPSRPRSTTSMDARDVIFTPLTDSMELYASRQEEMAERARPVRRAEGRRALRALPRGHRHRPLPRADATSTARRCTTSSTSPGSSSRARPPRSCASSGTTISGRSSSPRSRWTSGTS